MTKILFTDLDGTLLNDAGVVSEYTKEVLKKMVDAGHRLVLSSGRHLSSVIEVAGKAGLNYPGMYIVANNGAVVWDMDAKKPIYEKPVSMEMTRTLWDMAIEYGMHIQTYDDVRIISCKEGEELKVYTNKIHMPYVVVDEPETELVKAPYKLLGIELTDFEKSNRFKDDVNAKYGDVVQAVFSQPMYLELFSVEAGKGPALLWLCEHLGIPVSDSYSAGDAMNDLSMMKAAGHSIAMCNGDPGLFEYAEIISDVTNDEDGLAKIIEREIIG